MTIYSLSGYIQDSSINTEAANYGPHNVGAGWKVTKYEAIGTISLPGGSGGLDSTAYIYNPYCIGVQYGPTGYTPYGIGSGSALDDNTWLWAGRMPTQGGGIFWAPPSDTGALLPELPFHVLVYPQLLVPSGGLDFYLTVGVSVGTNGFYTWGSDRIWYSGGSYLVDHLQVFARAGAHAGPAPEAKMVSRARTLVGGAVQPHLGGPGHGPRPIRHAPDRPLEEGNRRWPPKRSS